jgi:hypothetical protein
MLLSNACQKEANLLELRGGENCGTTTAETQIKTEEDAESI